MIWKLWAWIALQITVGYNLFLPLALYASWRMRRARRTADEREGVESDYAIIVTAYEQTDSLNAVVDSVLRLNYSNYIVYIVADNCDVSRLSFPSSKVVLLRPPEKIANNVGSHFYAIKHFIREHERLTIIDSDNLVHPDYLLELDRSFDEGFEAVQGVRVAKNLNTPLACLDAARDIYYHFYDGKLMFEIGSSAMLAGSGMAFTVSCYRKFLEPIQVRGAGFDKVLQAEIVAGNNRISFCERALVYDEKTSVSEQLVSQRARWIGTWFRFFTKGFRILWAGVKGKSFNQVLFGLVLLRPPLFIFLIGSLFFMAVDVFIQPSAVLIWMVGLTAFVTGFVISLKSTDTDPRVYKALIQIPFFVLLQLKSLINSIVGWNRSVATPHSQHSEITDLNTKK